MRIFPMNVGTVETTLYLENLYLRKKPIYFYEFFALKLTVFMIFHLILKTEFYELKCILTINNLPCFIMMQLITINRIICKPPFINFV